MRIILYRIYLIIPFQILIKNQKEFHAEQSLVKIEILLTKKSIYNYKSLFYI